MNCPAQLPFHVTATNDFGESTASDATTAITSPAAPAAPIGLTATLSNGDLRLDWTAADSLATGYNIYESTDGGTTFNILDSVDGTTGSTSSPPATSYLATGLAAGATPRFYVTAQDSSGESGASSTVSRTMPAPFSGVTTTVNPVNGNVTIHWAADAGANGYLISRTADSDNTTVLLATVTPGSVTSYTDTTADVTKAYTYRVTPYFSTIAPTGVGPTGGNGGGAGGGTGGGGGN